MYPISIGIREAKTHLSKLLKMVQKGKEVILTDRGHPVGKIVPISDESRGLSERIRKLEEEALLEPPNKETPIIPHPIPVQDEIAQKYLQEDRDSGK